VQIPGYDLPGREGLLKDPFTVPGTDIEIVRTFDGSRISRAIFDNDGTLDDIRQTWVNLMVATNSAALFQALRTKSIGIDNVVSWCIGDIEATIGIPTYIQMGRLDERIKEGDGIGHGAQRYKDVYNEVLKAMVSVRQHRFTNSDSTFLPERTPSGVLAKLYSDFGEGYLLMAAMHTAVLCQTNLELEIGNAVNLVNDYIREDPGQVAMHYMRRLVDILSTHTLDKVQAGTYLTLFDAVKGGDAFGKNPETGPLTVEDLSIPGSLGFLEMIHGRLDGNVYLASGSDLDAITASSHALGSFQYFKQIVGAGYTNDLTVDQKEAIIKRFLDGEVDGHNLQPGELVIFEDGFPGILYGYRAGAVCVGVLTPDHSYHEKDGHFTVAQKRDRLVSAGAHILVPDFEEAQKLLQILAYTNEQTIGPLFCPGFS